MKGGEGLAVSVEARRGLESPPSRLAVKPRTVNSYRVAGSKKRGLNVHMKPNIQGAFIILSVNWVCPQ